MIIAGVQTGTHSSPRRALQNQTGSAASGRSTPGHGPWDPGAARCSPGAGAAGTALLGTWSLCAAWDAGRSRRGAVRAALPQRSRGPPCAGFPSGHAGAHSASTAQDALPMGPGTHTGPGRAAPRGLGCRCGLNLAPAVGLLAPSRRDIPDAVSVPAESARSRGPPAHAPRPSARAPRLRCTALPLPRGPACGQSACGVVRTTASGHRPLWLHGPPGDTAPRPVAHGGGAVRDGPAGGRCDGAATRPLTWPGSSTGLRQSVKITVFTWLLVGDPMASTTGP